MSNNFSLSIVKEILIIMIITILFVIITFSYKNYVSVSYMLFLFAGLFVALQYFRIILFERKIMWLNSFYIKLFICVSNIPLFFVALTHYMNFTSQYEDYNYTGIGVVTHSIFPGLSAYGYGMLRLSTYYIGIGAMILIVLVNFRLIYSVFAYREGPSFLKRD